jgi:hypothetical protein
MHTANDATAPVSGHRIRTGRVRIGLLSAMALVHLPLADRIMATTSSRCALSHGLRAANIE